MVNYEKLLIKGIKLNRDNQNGAGKGDDETATINFSAMDTKIDTIFVVCNVFNGIIVKGNKVTIRLYEGNSVKKLKLPDSGAVILKLK